MMDVIIVTASLVELALEISSLISDGEELQLTGMSGREINQINSNWTNVEKCQEAIAIVCSRSKTNGY